MGGLIAYARCGLPEAPPQQVHYVEHLGGRGSGWVPTLLGFSQTALWGSRPANAETLTPGVQNDQVLNCGSQTKRAWRRERQRKPTPIWTRVSHVSDGKSAAESGGVGRAAEQGQTLEVKGLEWEATNPMRDAVLRTRLLTAFGEPRGRAECPVVSRRPSGCSRFMGGVMRPGMELEECC